MAETIAPTSHVCPSRFVEDPQVILARCNWMREEKVGVSPFNMGVVHVLATLISGPCLPTRSGAHTKPAGYCNPTGDGPCGACATCSTCGCGRTPLNEKTLARLWMMEPSDAISVGCAELESYSLPALIRDQLEDDGWAADGKHSSGQSHVSMEVRRTLSAMVRRGVFGHVARVKRSGERADFSDFCPMRLDKCGAHKGFFRPNGTAPGARLPAFLQGTEARDTAEPMVQGDDNQHPVKSMRLLLGLHSRPSSRRAQMLEIARALGLRAELASNDLGDFLEKAKELQEGFVVTTKKEVDRERQAGETRSHRSGTTSRRRPPVVLHPKGPAAAARASAAAETPDQSHAGGPAPVAASRPAVGPTEGLEARATAQRICDMTLAQSAPAERVLQHCVTSSLTGEQADKDRACFAATLADLAVSRQLATQLVQPLQPLVVQPPVAPTPTSSASSGSASVASASVASASVASASAAATGPAAASTVPTVGEDGRSGGAARSGDEALGYSPPGTAPGNPRKRLRSKSPESPKPA
jgi:hypothetical protein